MSTNRELSEDDLQTLEKLGWQKNGDDFVGTYNTGPHPVAGLIRFEMGEWLFYIIDCPQPVLHGYFSGCLRKRPDYNGQTLHWVHFKTANPTPQSGIQAISKIIRDDLSSPPSASV